MYMLPFLKRTLKAPLATASRVIGDISVSKHVRFLSVTISNNDASSLDFRSDTVTQPTDEMRQAMSAATCGDDGYDDDPTCKALEQTVAELCEKEEGLFMVSSTMCNQVAVAANLHPSNHGRSDVVVPEIILDVRSHLHGRENGGLALLNRAHSLPLSAGSNGEFLTADIISKALHLNVDMHQPITTLVCLESPNWCGRIMDMKSLAEISKIPSTTAPGLRMHLDGTRLWNACVATGHGINEYAQHFDTVNMCLSKGLGAPIGGVLVGDAHTMHLARQYRKAFGGGWRQAGLLAQAGMYAIENHWQRMSIDHEKAKYIANAMQKLDFELVAEPETNIIVIKKHEKITFEALSKKLLEDGIKFKGKGDVARIYTHLHHTNKSINYLIERIEHHLTATSSP